MAIPQPSVDLSFGKFVCCDAECMENNTVSLMCAQRRGRSSIKHLFGHQAVECYIPVAKFLILFLLPLTLQPTVGFGLSNNILPFFPIYHHLSPSSHSQHLKISFCFLFPSFPWFFPFVSFLPVLG